MTAAIATWFAEQLDETTPEKRVIAGTLERALRYGENPHQWAAFYRTARAALRRRHRRAGAGQGALLQQSQRHRRGLRARRRVRSQGNRRPSPSSSTPIRAAWRSAHDAGRGLRQGAGLRLRERVRRHRRAQPRSRCGGRARDRQDLHRGDHRAGRERRGEGDHRREEEFAPAARRRPARPARATASPSARSPAAFWCRRATTAWSRRPI